MGSKPQGLILGVTKRLEDVIRYGIVDPKE